MKTKAAIVCAAVLIISVIIVAVVMLNNNNDSLASQLTGKKASYGPLEAATLTFWMQGPELNEESRAVIEEVEKKASELNVKIEFKMVWAWFDTYMTSVQGTIDAGEPCDAFYFSQREYNESFKSLADNGYAKDITKLLEEYAPSYYNKLVSKEILSTSINGKICAIPQNLTRSQVQCVIVREDLMSKYQIPEIKSIHDYELYLKAIKENEKDMIPAVFLDYGDLFVDARGYVMLDDARGLAYKKSEPGKILAWEQTPEFQEEMKTLKDWYDKGYLNKDVGFGSFDESLVTSGKWASFISNIEYQYTINEILKNQNASYKYKAYLFNPDEVYTRESPLNNAIVISPKSRNAERVLMFIEWLQSKQENYDSLMYGIKGKTYSLVGDRVTVPEKKDGITFNDFGWNYIFQNSDHQRFPEGVSDEILKEYLDFNEKKTAYAPLTGFTPDYGPVSDIAEKRRVSYELIYRQAFGGAMVKEDVDKFLEEQENNEADSFVKEVQRQLDKWMAEQKDRK